MSCMIVVVLAYKSSLVTALFSISHIRTLEGKTYQNDTQIRTLKLKELA